MSQACASFAPAEGTLGQLGEQLFRLAALPARGILRSERR
jgi:hypothetical protein